VDLALGLLDALPEETTRAARPHIAELPRVPLLRERLSSQQPATQDPPADARLRTQHAFKELFLAVARERPVSLFVDDLSAIDDESQAVLAALALETTPAELLLVTSLRNQVEALSFPVASLQKSATRFPLSPLSEAETYEILRSVFGDVPYLERCAQRLYRASEGNPAHCLELATRLISTGAARYIESSWALPTELDAGLLQSRHEAQVALIAGSPAQQRALAQLLSIPDAGTLSLAQCSAIGQLGAQPTAALLQQLCEARILRESKAGYRFAREDARAALQRELEPARVAQAHLRLAEVPCEGVGDVHHQQLYASLHLLRAGQLQRALRLLKSVDEFYQSGHHTSLRTTIPMIEQIYGLLRSQASALELLSSPGKRRARGVSSQARRVARCAARRLMASRELGA
jgi:predicted ATPase